MASQNKLTLSIRAVLLASMAFANSSFAQTTEEPKSEEDKLDEIVVTGTRIQNQSLTASSPVTEISSEDIKVSGATRIDDLIGQYPQISPVFDSFQNNPSTGYPTVDLRGLGPLRTLTLVNGQRLPPGASESSDISIIPASLVSRVDILTGGASAVYGSDAVAGVVNFILDTEFEGVSVNLGYNGYQHKNDNDTISTRLAARSFLNPRGSNGLEGISKNVDIALGSSFADGAGHAMAWVTWRENSALFQSQRDYSACALNAAGTACGGSGTNAAGNFYFYQPSSGFGSAASLNANGSWRNSYGAPYNYAPINYFQRPDERYTFGSSLKYEISDHFKPYLETMFTNRRDSTQIAESGTFFTPVTINNCANSLLRTACRDLGITDLTSPITVYVAKRNVEGGPRIRIDESNTFRVVSGLEGSISDNWSYNASVLLARVRDDSQGFNDLLRPRIVSAVLGCPAGSFAGCVPYNVWVPNGVTAAAANALSGTSILETATELRSFNAYVTGDAGFGFVEDENINVVAGIESRRTSYDFVADSDSQANNFAGAGAPAIPLNGEIKVKEFFAEAAVPIYRGDFVDAVDLDFGYRYSNYDRSGGADSFKAGFGALMGDYRVRGGFNRAIRAPSINETFGPVGIGLWGGTDPCSGARPEFSQAECARTGVTAAQYGRVPVSQASQYNQITGTLDGGLLVPETADTWTFGFVGQPIEGLSVSADYYQIEINDTLGSVGASQYLRGCALSGDPRACSQIRRNPASGDLFRGQDSATAGLIFDYTGNFGKQTQSGIDLGANYSFEWLAGSWTTGLNGSFLLEAKNEPIPGIQATDFSCEGLISTVCQNPEWRHIWSLNYRQDLFSVNARWRYIGSVEYKERNGRSQLVPGITDQLVRRSGDVNAYNYLDVSGSFYLGEYTELNVGVNNVFDRDPPLVGAGLALNANAPGGYDQVGRYIFTSVNFKF